MKPTDIVDSPYRRMFHPDAPLLDRSGQKHVSSIDLTLRRGDNEMYLNALAARVFATGGGAEFLEYLKDITIHRVLDFSASDGALRQMEGARWLVSVITKRVAAGKQQGEVSHVVPFT